MRVTITVAGGAVDHEFENVLQAGPTGNGQYFGVVQEVKEETTASGLVARVSGGKRHTLVPTYRVVRAVIKE